MGNVTLDYCPQEYQGKMHTDETRFKILAGGRRVGKSASAISEIIKHCLEMPNALAWWVSPTYQEAREVGWEAFNQYYDALLPAIKGYHQGVMRVEFINGSKIYFKGADRRDSLRGRGLTMLVGDEFAFAQRDIWFKVLRPALSDRKGKAVLPSSPNGRNWFMDLCDYAKDPRAKSWGFYHWPSALAPWMDAEELDDAKASMSEMDYRQEYLAEFITKAGQVYDDFGDKNIVEGFIPDKVAHEICIGADFGYANPSSIGFFAVDRFVSKVTLFDEVYGPRMDIETIRTKIVETLVKYDLTPGDVKWIATDPAGNAEELTSGISPVDYLRGEPYNFDVLNKGTKIAPGLALVRAYLCNAKKERRFFIDKRCEDSIKSMYGYTYTPINRLNQDVVHEEPLKDGIHDHACDMIRYFFVNRYDHAMYVGGKPQFQNYSTHGKMKTIMKRCNICRNIYPSRTPKGVAPIICNECAEKKELETYAN